MEKSNQTPAPVKKQMSAQLLWLMLVWPILGVVFGREDRVVAFWSIAFIGLAVSLLAIRDRLGARWLHHWWSVPLILIALPTLLVLYVVVFNP
jgi:hypothetical protein